MQERVMREKQNKQTIEKQNHEATRTQTNAEAPAIEADAGTAQPGRQVQPISRLGFGCMRLPSSFEKVETMILHALDLGIRYFDTAYIYPGNEALLGRVIKKNHCRSRIEIATKLPHYMIKKPEDPEKYFQIQLERLGTGYVDHYLMHMLPDVPTWNRLKGLGILEWLTEKKASGQIRRVGFSYHGGSRDFLALLDAYDWDFVQVQYNYMDEHSQAGRIGVERAAEKGIPVIIMEPLRGGLLTSRLPEEAKAMIKEHPSHRTAAAWSLRWLWDQPAVSCVLSGMNTMKMIDENFRTEQAAPAGCMTPEDHAFIERLQAAVSAGVKVGCTGCGYCMPCPFGVNIPGAFRCYNASYMDGYGKGFKEYVMNTCFTRQGSYAGLCRACGRCAPHCPQSIPIPDVLRKVRRRFEHPAFSGARWFIRRVMLRGKEPDAGDAE